MTNPTDDPTQNSLPQNIVDLARSVLGVPESPEHQGILEGLKRVMNDSVQSSHEGAPRPRLIDKVREGLDRSNYTGRARIHSRGSRVVGTVEIPLGNISTARLQNCRESDNEKEFQGLVESMLADGLINPVTVIRDSHIEGRFILVAGFRRLRAAAELGWTMIRATVIEVESEADAHLVNLLENAARKDISNYEMARQCEYLTTRFGLREKDLAQRLGLTYAHIHNLIRYLSLPPPIVSAWRERHPLLTLPRLQRLAASPLALDMWARMQAQYTMETGRPDPTFQDLLDEQLKEEDPGEDGHAAYKPPSRRGMMKLRDVVAAQRLPTEPAKVRAMMVGIVDYCRGASPTIPHVVIAPLRRRAPPRR